MSEIKGVKAYRKPSYESTGLKQYWPKVYYYMLRFHKRKYLKKVSRTAVYQKRYLIADFFQSMFRSCYPYFYILTYPGKTNLVPFRRLVSTYNLKAYIVTGRASEFIFNFAPAQNIFSGRTIVIYGTDQERFLEFGVEKVWETILEEEDESDDENKKDEDINDDEEAPESGFSLIMVGFDKKYFMPLEWEEFIDSPFRSNLTRDSILMAVHSNSIIPKLDNFVHQTSGALFFRALMTGFDRINKKIM